jgi:hypothetical protein
MWDNGIYNVAHVGQWEYNLTIPSGIWNGFGLQMDLNPPLEGRLQEVEEEDKSFFQVLFF